MSADADQSDARAAQRGRGVALPWQMVARPTPMIDVEGRLGTQQANGVRCFVVVGLLGKWRGLCPRYSLGEMG